MDSTRTTLTPAERNELAAVDTLRALGAGHLPPLGGA